MGEVSQSLDWSITSVGAQWANFWWSVMPFTINQQEYVMVYTRAGGITRFDRFTPDGFGTVNLKQTTLAVSSDPEKNPVSIFMPYYVNGVPHFIAYSVYSGDVMFARINADGSDYTVLSRGVWGKGWSSLVSYTIGGQPYFIAYNVTTGQVHFDKISADGSGFSILASGFWAPGWSSIVTYNSLGLPYLVVHNGDTALTRIDAIKLDGTGSVNLNSFNLVGHNQFFIGYQALTVFQQGLKTYLMPYWSVAGDDSQYEIVEVSQDGTITRLGKAPWDGDFDIAAPYKIGSQNYFIAYSGVTGKVFFDKITFATATPPTPQPSQPWIWATQVDNAVPWGWKISGAGFQPNSTVGINVTVNGVPSGYFVGTNALGSFSATIVNLPCVSPNVSNWQVTDGSASASLQVKCTAL
ncbi:hypothetical protein LZ198_12100 [Myxococcus sp. K15C18031901]|uniref:hypothetical protein n=1 Tax=Myxococcus dinghuensis TaxID=2906761 RepID=UPI0020A82B83|nr:hypothetical protein [Myxococcus dinghuensis]MCP3099610.1 hypothetical protein [Myxococcus dinghuensis]